MILLDGKTVAETKKALLKERVATCGYTPRLIIVQIGDNPASEVYVSKKAQFGKEIGVDVVVCALPHDTTTEQAIAMVSEASARYDVHGVIVQLPVPKHINKEAVINSIDADKDVDGLTAVNMWKLMDDNSGIIPATALGVSALLNAYDIALEGKRVVIVGDSLLVGKSTAMHFLNQKATVTVCHDKTIDLAQMTQQADILVVAVGKPGLISSEHVRAGQIVIDIGITRNIDGSVVGDVVFDAVAKVVHAITPVPGGVGPMTVVSLFENMLHKKLTQSI